VRDLLDVQAQAGVAPKCPSFDAPAGGTAIYETSPLQKRFRDVHAATQHMLIGPSTWELTGRLMLGLPTDIAQL